MQSAVAKSAGNTADAEYSAFLQRVSNRFHANTAGRSVFTTAAEGIWEAYLLSFEDAAERQHHNCNTCRHFLQRYAGLVTIQPDGSTRSALWNEEDAPEGYRIAVYKLARLAESAKVTGVFLASDPVLGHPLTGAWQHLHARNPAPFRQTPAQTAGQGMAEKREDFKNVLRALSEFSADVVNAAVQLLEANALYRAERVLGPAKWLQDVHAARAGKQGQAGANVLWTFVATAPAGYAHPRSSMIGTLLEDIAAGLPTAEISRRFAEKMDPLQYQRATAAPTGGQIAAAEQAVQALGIAPAFARRYAVASDFDRPGAVLWRPSEPAAARPAPAPKAAGTFDHLKPAAPAAPAVDVPPRLMTWEKFQRDVLPGAAVIQYRVPLVGRFCALTAAQDPAAPPILQWDAGERNTVSWAFPNPPARADEWGLVPGALAPVRMIATTPNTWGERAADHHGKGVFLLLEGARDVRGLPGGGLFTEHLRNDLKPYRATIEAHLNGLVVAGADDPATVGFGIGLLAGNDWTEAAAPQAPAMRAPGAAAAPDRIHVILVVDDSGSMRGYIGAARMALASLLGAVRVMPGQVDVTVYKFGDRWRVLCERAPLAQVEGVEAQLTGDSGSTALNDTIGAAIGVAQAWPDANAAGTSFFLGIVTDGEENHSTEFTLEAVRQLVQRVTATGRWTVAYAGAGSNPRSYARQIGIPDGNVTAFEASARGFEDVGNRYASSTRSLASAYRSGARASTSFFAAASGREAIGSDHPVLVVTTKSGAQGAYKLDRWE